MEEKKEVKPFQIDFKCPKCPIGYLRPTGIAIGGTPLRYPHICNNPECDYKEIMKGKIYPHVIYEPLFNNIYEKDNNNIEYVHGKDYVDNNGHLFIGTKTEKSSSK
ncbi:MAG: hypothetical protein WC428_01795 [Candidatus Paceibacterota bacterium]|jgi:hypothetical protein